MSRRRLRHGVAAILLAAWLLAPHTAQAARTAHAARTAPRPVSHEPGISVAQRAFADTLERRTFFFFWDLADPMTGLMPDRWPTQSFISVGATGFALTALPIGAERHWITRDRKSVV